MSTGTIGALGGGGVRSGTISDIVAPSALGGGGVRSGTISDIVVTSALGGGGVRSGTISDIVAASALGGGGDGAPSAHGGAGVRSGSIGDIVKCDIAELTVDAPALSGGGCGRKTLAPVGGSDAGALGTDSGGALIGVTRSGPIGDGAPSAHGGGGVRVKAPATGEGGTVYGRSPHGPSAKELAEAATRWLTKPVSISLIWGPMMTSCFQKRRRRWARGSFRGLRLLSKSQLRMWVVVMTEPPRGGRGALWPIHSYFLC